MAAKELNNVKVEITIGGKKCDFSTMTLHQTLSSHHRFIINVNYRAKQKSVWEEECKTVFEKLNEKVVITITDNEGAKNVFEGVVQHIDIEGESSNQGGAVITGGSPTLLMVDDFHMDSFSDMGVGDIVHEVIRNLGIDMATKIEPESNSELPFVYRYKESSYGFLRRLTVACGESFYYDGRQLVVGFPKETGETIGLSFKNDLMSMSLCSSISNYDVERYDYDPARDKLCQQISDPKGNKLGKFAYKALEKSQKVYKDFMVLPSAIAVRTQRATDIIIRSTNNAHFSKVNDGCFMKATTSTCKIKLNSAIFIETDPDLAKHTRELDKFRVIEVTHHFDENKNTYYNEFTAANIEVAHFPIRDYVEPMAMPEVATVVDNADPMNLGRVKVKFMWQRLDDHPQNKTSAWMRVQTPDAGSSDAVAKNRGLFFVPEIGDQVMVGFELGDPDRPFVMGSVFYKNNAQGIAENNKLKSITTRSGSTLTIDDDAHTILLCTSKANQIFIDEKNGSISIKALDEINISSKNINIDASENITISAGKQLDVSVGGDYIETVNSNKSISIDGKMETNIGKNYLLNIDEDHISNITGAYESNVNNLDIMANGKAQISSSSKLTLASGDKVNIAQG